MPDLADKTFYFRAVASDGSSLAGELSATGQHDALRRLRTAGYIPLRLETRPIRESLLQRQIAFGNGRRLTIDECEAFIRELSILLGSGVELTGALAILSESLPQRSRARRFADELRHWLRMGSGLADATRKTRFAIPADVLPAIEAGERAGKLAAALTMIADRLHDSGKLSRTVTGALAYPLFLLVVAVAVVAILAFFVAPNLAVLFAAMDKPVPTVIAVLTALASGIRANAAVVTGGLVTLAFSALLIGRLPGARRAMRRLAFTLPVLGQALSWAAAGRFAGTLRLFLANNVPIATALPSAYAAAGLPADADTTWALAEEIRRGHKLSTALERDGMLPLKVVHLIRVGETNARLPEVLGGVVEDARLRFEQRLALLTALLAPTLIVAVGSLVGWIILTVFSALLGINDLAS